MVDGLQSRIRRAYLGKTDHRLVDMVVRSESDGPGDALKIAKLGKCGL